ncbi:MAG TPA: DUF5602 domain-containing protein [Armatimonadota bacterium]|jgi:hypothetical protein
MRIVSFFAISTVVVVQLLACRPALSQARTYLGEIRPVGQGTVATFVTVDPGGNPVTLGVTFTPGLFIGLPPIMSEAPLAFPAQAQGLPFTHFVLNWNPQGHFPVEFYGAPHFDFHFYLITPEVRSGITATGEDAARVAKVPPPQYVPQGYVYAPGGEEPRMGAHWIVPSFPEFHGTPFTESFIFGTYNGRLAYLEPMMTVAWLHTRSFVDKAIPQPPAYEVAGYYPTRYRISYDPARTLYTVALTGFTYRRAQ